MQKYGTYCIIGKVGSTHSLPNSEHKYQWRVNDSWPFIVVNHSPMHQLLNRYDMLTVSLGQNANEISVAAR